LETGEPTDAVSELLNTQPAEPDSWRGVRSSKMAVRDAPSMDIDQPLPLTEDMADLDSHVSAMISDEPGSHSEPSTRTPAEAAAA
ncbi:MAG: hypothetical protein E5Y18_28400, partial [Mesorhizobium sp.]